MITSCDKGICIPRIQRDYAQGRIGKELLRKRLLSNFKEALDCPQTPLLLDFIYGSLEDDGRYYPLDGQQRLTTLWLLHWYVAYHAEQLEDNNRSCLAKFSYETRRSSTDFCNFLCRLKYDTKVTNLRDYISSQTGFSARWMLDPTVSAMLNTLCGTDEKDQDKNDIMDGLAELFVDTSREKFGEYWALLSGNECPIRFYNLDMRGENLPLSDDLYIKMNARGKQLSDWENFKADLLEFSDDSDALGKEIDNCWTDLFWKNHSDGKIDAILFAFVNRYIFNEYLLRIGDEKHEPTQHSLFQLYGKEGNDTSITYEDFARYTSDNICKDVTKSAINKLRLVMNRLLSFARQATNNWERLRDIVQAGWSENTKFEFIPRYIFDENNKFLGISNITLKQRLVFLAVCRYFEIVEEIEVEKLKDWIRFTWKIADYIRTDAMSNAFMLIDKKSIFCQNIMSHLESLSSANDGFATDLINEEIEKAQYIQKDPDNRKDPIQEAENFRDLHGRIGFMFHNEKGGVDWNLFKSKYERLGKLFSKSGNSSDALKQANLLKTFLSYCTNIEQIESSTNNYSYIYDYSWESWKANFLHHKYTLPTHKVLMDEKMLDIDEAAQNFEKSESTDSDYTKIYRWMLETNLLENVAERLKSGRQRPYLRRYYEVLCLYPSAEGINMENAHRDKLLQTLYNKKIIQLDENILFSNAAGCRLFLKGWHIYFSYNGVPFCWSWDNELYVNDLVCGPISKDISEGDFIELLKRFSSANSANAQTVVQIQ